MLVPGSLEHILVLARACACLSCELLTHAIRTSQVTPPRQQAQTLRHLQLKPVEREMLRLLGRGLSNKEIAARTGHAESTIKNRLSAVYDKLHVGDRTQAALMARDLGIIDQKTLDTW